MNEEQDLDLEAPTAKAKADPSLAANNGLNEAGSDSEDEAAPDFAQLVGLAKKMNARFGAGDGQASAAPFIPKRGEKDFEPTGFRGQNNALEHSRKAMFEVISSQRLISSKSIAIATWVPHLNRAIVHLARGQAFGSMGTSRRVALLEDGSYEDLAQHYHESQRGTPAPRAGTMKEGVFWPKMQSRLELLPEEALYLVERGSLECRQMLNDDARLFSLDIADYESETLDTAWVPMSVQQAYAVMIGKDGLSRPRYQLYAYLKRLGYIVQRKAISDELRTLANKTNRTKDEASTAGVIADPNHPLRLVSLMDVFLYPLRRIVQIGQVGLSSTSRVMHQLAHWLIGVAGRILPDRGQSHANRRHPGLLGIGSTRWTSYDEIYDRLRIIPTSHELPAHMLGRTKETDRAPEIFFYAWRPATQFKKTDPPLPEYQIAVVDARKSPLPSAFAFADLFSTLPMPLSATDLDGLDEDEQREWKKAQEQRKRNDESYGRGAVKKREQEERRKKKEMKGVNSQRQGSAQLAILVKLPLQRLATYLYVVHRLFAHLPPGCTSRKSSTGRGAGGRRTANGGQGRSGINVYTPLKHGRRNVIVAVNDCGTTSLLRFGEADFERWRIAGTQREGK